MTIRQAFIVASTPAGVSDISFVGSADAVADSVSIPTHTTGDYIVIAATGSDAPTIPVGWTSLGTGTYGFGQDAAVAYKVASSGSEVSGTWTNATNMVVAVYRGPSAVGTAVTATGASTATYSAVSVAASTSWVVGIGFGQSVNMNSAPTGMTNRDSSSGTRNIGLHDTASGVSSWSSKTVYVGGSNRTYVFELQA